MKIQIVSPILVCSWKFLVLCPRFMIIKIFLLIKISLREVLFIVFYIQITASFSLNLLYNWLANVHLTSPYFALDWLRDLVSFMIILIVVFAKNYYVWIRNAIFTWTTLIFFYFSMNSRQWTFWLQCCFCMQKRKKLFGFWLLYVNECCLIILIVESLVKKTHTYTNTYFFSKQLIVLLSVQWKNWSLMFWNIQNTSNIKMSYSLTCSERAFLYWIYDWKGW